jgi:hypothetical protein
LFRGFPFKEILFRLTDHKNQALSLPKQIHVHKKKVIAAPLDGIEQAS